MGNCKMVKWVGRASIDLKTGLFIKVNLGIISSKAEES